MTYEYTEMLHSEGGLISTTADGALIPPRRGPSLIEFINRQSVKGWRLVTILPLSLSDNRCIFERDRDYGQLAIRPE